MSSVWSDRTRLVGSKPWTLPQLIRRSKEKRKPRLFYIPAQRVMSLRDGQTKPFSQFRGGDSYVLRTFGQQIHDLVNNELSGEQVLFPKSRRLEEILRHSIDRSIFGGFELAMSEPQIGEPMLVLRRDEQEPPVSVWSAGQREFTPLLLGLYKLLPSAAQLRRDEYEWVVIEEPEMGLHPQAIRTVSILIVELLSRGYRVCLSTRSNEVLTLVWSLGVIQECGGDESDVRRLLGLNKTPATVDMAECAVAAKLKCYFFSRDQAAQDITTLDPGADDAAVSDWGGLSEFASRSGEIVAALVQRQVKAK